MFLFSNIFFFGTFCSFKSSGVSDAVATTFYNWMIVAVIAALFFTKLLFVCGFGDFEIGFSELSYSERGKSFIIYLSLFSVVCLFVIFWVEKTR